MALCGACEGGPKRKANTCSGNLEEAMTAEKDNGTNFVDRF